MDNKTWLRVCLHLILALQAFEEVLANKRSGCYASLGMQSGSIKDSQIHASTSLEYAPAHSGRLNNTRSTLPLSLGAWCANNQNIHQYLHIDLLTVKNVTGITSQGLKISGGNWVSSYSISYSCDGRLWIPYLFGGIPKIFNANYDSDTPTFVSLPTPIITRVIRIHPITWNPMSLICMRVEMHGCHANKVCRPTSSPTTALPTTTLRYTSTTVPNIKTSLPVVVTMTQTTTRAATTKPACESSLGMKNYRIKNSQISASSYQSILTLPSAARLNNRLKPMSLGSWCAKSADTKQYLQIDLIQPNRIVAVATQGMAMPEGNWVTSFSLGYSCNGLAWFMYEERGKRKVFQGNADGRSTVINTLKTPLTTRLVRLRPVTWNALGEICLRMELYGCSTSKACTAGNTSESTSPSIRTAKGAHTTGSSTPTNPITHSEPTANLKGSQPTGHTEATKNKKRIVIIYKKLDDDVAVSSSTRNRLGLINVILILVFRLT